ncbi:unnamed protein product [Rotaria socialis]|uniref:Uncharacterized protein n=1 Tax=Rotaria socialis TaxID=392032 RepID=A0A820H5W0_9BILA|nr:unnamed protein product [Rotaria socialis]
MHHASRQSTCSQALNQIPSDNVINTKSHTNISQQLPRTSQVKVGDKSILQPNPTDNQTTDVHSRSVFIDPNLQWHSVTSKSLFEVPRLSNTYSDIPLHITLPDRSPTHNQKLLHKHDVALENRLLNAGLSPETIALYERILEVSDVRQMAIKSPPKIINQYRHK